jgi:prefoldin subunit 5
MLETKELADLIAQYEDLRRQLAELDAQAELLDRELIKLEELLPDGYVHADDRMYVRVRPR